MQAQQARAAQQQTQQVQPQGPIQNQAQNLNINGNLPNGSHLSAYVNRDTAPSSAHVSPPHAAALSNAVASPRPPSAQAHTLLQATQPPGNGIPRQGANAYYGLPAIQNIRDFTQEQIHAALRIHQVGPFQDLCRNTSEGCYLLKQQQAQQQQGSAQLPSNNFAQQP